MINKNMLIAIFKQIVSEKLKEAVKAISLEVLRQAILYIQNELRRGENGIGAVSGTTAAKFNIPSALAFELVTLVKKHFKL